MKDFETENGPVVANSIDPISSSHKSPRAASTIKVALARIPIKRRNLSIFIVRWHL